MTREEAIEFIVQSVKDDVDMAKVADGLKKFDFILDARDKIKNLPSVTPKE